MTKLSGLYPNIASDGKGIMVMIPDWLDDVIFNDLGGNCNPSREERAFDSNLEATKSKVMTYLGTYFPRSLAESFVIYDSMLSDSCYADMIMSEEDISICSVGTGTGGDLIGLLLALARRIPKQMPINIVSIEGNRIAHSMMEHILVTTCQRLQKNISLRRVDYTFRPPRPFESKELFLPTSPKSFDFILSCKMLNELDSKGVSAQPYYEFCKSFLPLLKPIGTALVLDVTSSNGAYGRWTPKVLNGQINQYLIDDRRFKTILPLICNRFEGECSNDCYTQNTVHVSYRNEQNVCTKICYRVIGSFRLADKLSSSTALWDCPITEDNRGLCRVFRG